MPGDNLRGYYRVETIEPHRTSSNIVSYNLEDCTGEQGSRSLGATVAIVGDPDRLRRAFEAARARTDAYEGRDADKESDAYGEGEQAE